MDDEQRKTTRRRQLKAATIAFNNRHSTMPCVVREISDDGARIEAAGNMIPDTFELLIELDGIEVHCQVAWRRTNEVGVAFLAPPVRKAPRRAQVVDAVRDKGPATSLRKKPLMQSPVGIRDIPPPPSGIPPPPAEPNAPASPSQTARQEPSPAEPFVTPAVAPPRHAPPPASSVALAPAAHAPLPEGSTFRLHERATPLSQPVEPPPARPQVHFLPEAPMPTPHPTPPVQPRDVPAPHSGARPHQPAPQPAKAAGPPKPAPAPVRLGLPPAGCRFPQGAQFVLKPVSGLPPSAESAFHAAVTATLREVGLAAEPGQPAPYSLTGLLSANRSGDTVTFAYLFDITNRSGRPMHRIAGQETANLYRERSVWNPIEGELSKRIAAVIARDLASQIGGAA